MQKFRNKAVGILASLGLVLQLFFLPGAAFADVSASITGNGSDSDNTVSVTTQNTVSVDQSNDLDVDNDVDVDTDTGNNSASGNTGGSVLIDTGNIDTDVSISTLANKNIATVVSPSATDPSFEIEFNGTNSDNDIDYDATNTVAIDQDNDADVDNDVDIDADTGNNDADDNTYGGVTVRTGDISINSGVSIDTTVNANHAYVGTVGNTSGSLSASILGNGSNSDSLIDVVIANTVALDQDNDADVDNDVDVDADTGNNDANDNTLAQVLVETGKIDVDVSVDTLANFNGANVWGGYVGDIALATSLNGTNSDNDIDFDLADLLAADQDNDLDVDNEDLDIDADSGNNDGNDNTVGGVEIQTGWTTTDVWANTKGNANIFGTGLFGDSEVDLTFSLSGLWLSLFANS